MADTNVYNSDELQIIYSFAKHLDAFWSQIQEYSHWEPNRLRLMFKLTTEKAFKTGQITANMNMVDKLATNLYMGPWGKSIEFCIHIYWVEKPPTLVKSVYEKSTQIS